MAEMRSMICDERGDRGFSWTVDEFMQRTGHALAHGGRVWLVDPIDDQAAIERAASLGRFAGVLQLLDRHRRDCAAVAERLGVPHLCCPGEVPGSPFATLRLTWRPWWREVALWWADEALLVVPEALGTNRYFTAGRGPLGVHPMLRLVPPRRLTGYSPRHLLVGHGVGLHGDDAGAAIGAAIADARRGIPGLLRALPSLRS